MFSFLDNFVDPETTIPIKISYGLIAIAVFILLTIALPPSKENRQSPAIVDIVLVFFMSYGWIFFIPFFLVMFHLNNWLKSRDSRRTTL